MAKKPHCRQRKPAAQPRATTSVIPTARFGKFLDALAECGNISFAADAAGIRRSTIYLRRDQEPGFAKQLAEAQQLGRYAVRDEAIRRAVQGVDKPVFQGGKKVGLVREYSDALLALLLKGFFPDEFRERVETKLSGALKVERVHDLSDDELAAIAAGGRGGAAKAEEGEK